MSLYPSEQLPGPRNTTSLVVEIGKRVRPAQVMPLGTLRCAPVLFEYADGACEIALVGFRAGHDDPTLGHQLGRRRSLSELLPQCVDLSLIHI